MHLNAAKRLPLEFKMILIRWIFWSLDKHMVIGDLLLPTAYTRIAIAVILIPQSQPSI